MGLELELIELVHRRGELSDRDQAGREQLDREIAQVLTDLERVADLVSA